MNRWLFPICLFSTFTALSQQGSWQVLKTKNKTPNCSECGMAAVGNKLYLLGGDGGGARAVQAYDPQTGTWTKRAQAPVQMHHFQAVPYQSKIYVLEAFSGGGFPDQTPMPNAYSYDTQKDSWQKEGEIPADRRRAGAGAVAYQGKLYLVAGIQHGHSSGTTNMFDQYDPQTMTWTALPDAPHIRDHCSAAVINGKLYVVGGRNTSYRDPQNKVPFFAKTMLDVDVYDFATGKWATLPGKLPMGSGGGAVINLGNVLYYMGGERATENEPNAPRKNTYFLNPDKGKKWQETDSVHYARNGMAAAVLNGRIYIGGGSGGGPGGPPPPIGAPTNGMPPLDTSHSDLPTPPNSGQGNKGSQKDWIILEVFNLNKKPAQYNASISE